MLSAHGIVFSRNTAAGTRACAGKRDKPGGLCGGPVGVDRARMKGRRRRAALVLSCALTFLPGLAAAQAKPEVPAVTDGAIHYLEEGESLWTVARNYGVPIDTLRARNNIL